jgi:hypothetical protein
MEWFNSSNGKSYIYYSDAWVELDSNGVTAASTGNAIINGAFDIWQRGTSFSGGAGVYTADRWAFGLASSTAVRSTDTPTGSGFSAIISRTTGSVSGIRYRMEANDSRLLKGETVTLSWWAKEGAADSSTANVEFRYPTATDNFGTVTTFSSGQVGTLSTSWQKFSKTILLPAEVSNGLELLFVFSGINRNHFISEVQLEAGTVATPFRRNAPSIQAELAACQRYYYTSGGAGYGYMGMPIASFLSVAEIVGPFPVTMRATPSVSGNVGQSGIFADPSGNFTSSVSPSGIGRVSRTSGNFTNNGTPVTGNLIASAEL